MFGRNEIDSNKTKAIIKKAAKSAGYEFTDKQADEVIEQFWTIDGYNTLLAKPQFSKILAELLVESKLKFPGRYDFYTYLFNRYIGNDVQVWDGAMQLALRMEQLQVNELPKAQFVRTIEGILTKSNLTADGLIGKIKEILREEGDNIGFSHHTVQEYLAAHYVLAQANSLQFAEELTILKVKEMVAVKPSWYGVLRFLFESKNGSEYVNWILEIAEEYKENVDQNFANYLTALNPQSLKPQIVDRIFNLIYREIQAKRIWLPVWARINLGKFCSTRTYPRLKADIVEAGSETDIFVRKGNVTSIVEELIKLNSPLLDESEKTFWKNKLIEFAIDPNPNGVLQREALSALKLFKDASVIKHLDAAFTGDKLKRESYLDLCSALAPNAPETVSALVAGFKADLAIHARYGLYQLKTPESLGQLLEYFVTDAHFAKEFLDDESIFSHKDDNGDKELIAHIAAALKKDLTLLPKIKSAIYAIVEDGKHFHADDSPFVRALTKMASQYDVSLLQEILIRVKQISPADHGVFRYSSIISSLLTPDNVIEYWSAMADIVQQRSYHVAQVIYRARSISKLGELAYKKAVSQGIIERIPKSKPKTVEPNKLEYERFYELYEPKPDKYYPEVFEFFADHYSQLKAKIKAEEIARLEKIAFEDWLEKLDPRDIKLTITRNPDGTRTSTYSITSWTAHFGSIIKAAKILNPQRLSLHRQKIIDFIPFAYSEEQQIILDTIDTIADPELEFINSTYLDKSKDVRYLRPQAYSYLIEKFLEKGSALPSTQRVLQSFVEDREMDSNDRAAALETLRAYLTSLPNGKKYLQTIFSDNPNESKLSELANAYLITIFKDEQATLWRLEQIQRRAQPYEGVEGSHEISAIERELDDMTFASPLLNAPASMLPSFIRLLDYSLTLKIESKFRSYKGYIWRIITGFLNNLPLQDRYAAYRQIATWYKHKTAVPESNWFAYNLEEIRSSLISDLTLHDLFPHGA
jgi:hypothetical protein